MKEIKNYLYNVNIFVFFNQFLFIFSNIFMICELINIIIAIINNFFNLIYDSC